MKLETIVFIILFVLFPVSAGFLYANAQKNYYHFLHSTSSDTCYMVKNNSYRYNDIYYVIKLENGTYINLIRSEYIHSYELNCPICNEPEN